MNLTIQKKQSVRGLDEDEPIDPVNDIAKNRVHLNSGLKKFEHEFEDTRSITEQIIFEDTINAEYARAKDEFAQLIGAEDKVPA